MFLWYKCVFRHFFLILWFNQIFRIDFCVFQSLWEHYLFQMDISEVNLHSNALVNITRRLTRWCQKFATVYAALFFRKSDAIM